MTELAEAVMLTPSGVSRLVGRLEREGLVARRPAGDDGRSFRTRLTAAGAEALDEARHTHNAVVRELYLDRLDAAARKQLGSAWAAVLTP